MEGQNYHLRHFLGKLREAVHSPRFARTFFVSFFTIFLPLYLFIGFQPTLPADAADLPTLNIPDIALETPVATVELKNHELATPALIAGAFSMNETKTLLIGHSSSVFKDLHHLQLGAELVYDNAIYQISQIETLAKSDISMNAILAPASAKTLVLMTCAGEPLPDQDATHRLIISATLVE